MNNYDDVARVREIKSLLDRIQQMPLPPTPPEPPLASLQHPQWQPDGQYAVATYDQAPEQNGSALSPWLFVIATALNTIVAAVLAVLITLGVVSQGPARSGEQLALGQPTTRSIALADTQDTPTTTASVVPVVSTRAIVLAPIGSPEQPLRFEPRKPMRLPLQVEPEEAARETFILVLSGLPVGTTLSGARTLGSDSWFLPPNSLARLELTFAEWSANPIDVSVELRRMDGSIAAGGRAWLVVPPPHFATPAKLDQAALGELLQKGDQLLGRGDVVGARAVYERAAVMGSGPAALALGATYDPGRLWSLGVFGMVGNKERARQWYTRADQLGHPGAKERLKLLGD